MNATFKRYSLNESDGILLARYCPLDYCKSGEKIINLNIDPKLNAQCANNHAGILCGGCETNYSLAIGSSRCIRCSNDSSLLLFIFFIAAGLLLVIFILALNLTVIQKDLLMDSYFMQIPYGFLKTFCFRSNKP